MRVNNNPTDTNHGSILDLDLYYTHAITTDSHIDPRLLKSRLENDDNFTNLRFVDINDDFAVLECDFRFLSGTIIQTPIFIHVEGKNILLGGVKLKGFGKHNRTVYDMLLYAATQMTKSYVRELEKLKRNIKDFARSFATCYGVYPITGKLLDRLEPNHD